MNSAARHLAVAARIEVEPPSSDLNEAIAAALGYVETPAGWQRDNDAPPGALPAWLHRLDHSAALRPSAWAVARITTSTDDTLWVVELRHQQTDMPAIGIAATEEQARAAAAFRAMADDAE